MTNQFRIEKVRVPTRIQVAGVGVLEGDIFLQPTMPYRTGAQRPVELLDDRDPFFPIAVAEGEYILVAKANVIRLDCPDVGGDESGVNEPVGVEVRLRDGSVLHGDVLAEVRSERARLLDFLNGFTERFLVVRTQGGECLVNREYIATVAQVSRPTRAPG